MQVKKRDERGVHSAEFIICAPKITSQTQQLQFAIGDVHFLWENSALENISHSANIYLRHFDSKYKLFEKIYKFSR